MCRGAKIVAVSSMPAEILKGVGTDGDGKRLQSLGLLFQAAFSCHDSAHVVFERHATGNVFADQVDPDRGCLRFQV